MVRRATEAEKVTRKPLPVDWWGLSPACLCIAKIRASMRRMILLLMFIGAVFVYLLAFLAVIAAFVGLCISFLISLLVYGATFVWSALRHRSTPEWKFERKPWTPNLDNMEAYAVGAGVLSMGYMVIGTVTYAISHGSWETTISVTLFAIVLTLLMAWQERDEILKS